MDTGPIRIETPPPMASTTRQQVALYARVASAEHKSTLECQAERLGAYCTARGYQVAKVVKDVGSGINDA